MLIQVALLLNKFLTILFYILLQDDYFNIVITLCYFITLLLMSIVYITIEVKTIRDIMSLDNNFV